MPFFKNLEDPGQSEEIKEEDLALKEKRRESRRKDEIGDIFDQFDNGDERVEYVMKNFVKSRVLDSKDIEKLLKNCVSIEDKNEFVDKVFSILKPVFEVGLLHDTPKIRINKVTDYSIMEDGKTIDLHLPATGIKDIYRIIELYKDGLKELAKEVKNNPDIIEIRMDSRLIKKFPGWIERHLGFKVKEGEGDKITSRTASLSRYDFLEKFGKREE